MSVTKQEALAAIAGLPEDVSLPTIIQRLQQIHRIQQGIRDATSLSEGQRSPPISAAGGAHPKRFEHR